MNQRDPRMSDRRIPILGAIGLALVAAINLFWASLAVCSSDTTKDTIIEEWDKVRIPPPPELKAITVDPKVTALLILDIQNSNCNPERRPRCVATLPSIQSLLAGGEGPRCVFYRNVGSNEKPKLAAGKRLDFREPAGGADYVWRLEVTDWNNDGKKDLLVGNRWYDAKPSSGGNIWLFLAE